MTEATIENTASTYTVDSTSMNKVLTTSEMKTLDPTVKAKMMKHFSDMQKQCTLDSATAAQVPALQKENNQLQQQVLALKDSISTLKQQQTLVGAISTMPGCIVLVVLIAAITAIALRKGVSFSKGDTKVSIGGEEKK
ncbi:MAG: hypothetical protein MJY99_05255 [Fibrobacter sp.]|nr:hypothetical protein [Fibrobacter sp.]